MQKKIIGKKLIEQDLRKAVTNSENPLPLLFPEHISLALLLSPLSFNSVEHFKYNFYLISYCYYLFIFLQLSVVIAAFTALFLSWVYLLLTAKERTSI